MTQGEESKSGVTEFKLGGGIVIKLIGCVFLAASAFLATLGAIESSDDIFIWAVWTAFGWHLTFLKHGMVIDRNRRRFIRQISSLFPIYKFEANLDAIRGFAVSRALLGRDRYGRKVFELTVLFDSGKRQKLIAGSKQELIERGKDIAKLCDKPFHIDEA
ncbi:hypothetical protein LRP49_02115 [Enterovibrio sp. ZSDZ35]|uniref:DUF304 domain-containing protein n=1 Tax=Enterovibrio qingdaonensis TaxID=2899818 RepID=A0ABT5QG76_9GAMM|nr:hypothetical protein [Enterovibrio sp. ZSDZ35]MDD1779982.1 hypothetical protein [Enterovibrio sp. ZSDZ35]